MRALQVLAWKNGELSTALTMIGAITIAGFALILTGSR